MDSLLFKVESDYEHFYSDALTPRLHYIPIKKDLSDLIEMISWWSWDDKLSRGIIDAAGSVIRSITIEKEKDKFIQVVNVLTEIME